MKRAHEQVATFLSHPNWAARCVAGFTDPGSAGGHSLDMTALLHCYMFNDSFDSIVIFLR